MEPIEWRTTQPSFSANLRPKTTSLVLWLAPAAIIGTIAGRRLTLVIPDGLFFQIVQFTLLLLSIKLIADYVITFVP